MEDQIFQARKEECSRLHDRIRYIGHTDELHTIFLLKKNVRLDIIKTILGYLFIAALETLKEWKVVIILVGQEYESIEG